MAPKTLEMKQTQQQEQQQQEQQQQRQGLEERERRAEAQQEEEEKQGQGQEQEQGQGQEQQPKQGQQLRRSHPPPPPPPPRCRRPSAARPPLSVSPGEGSSTATRPPTRVAAMTRAAPRDGPGRRRPWPLASSSSLSSSSPSSPPPPLAPALSGATPRPPPPPPPRPPELSPVRPAAAMERPKSSSHAVTARSCPCRFSSSSCSRPSAVAATCASSCSSSQSPSPSPSLSSCASPGATHTLRRHRPRQRQHKRQRQRQRQRRQSYRNDVLRSRDGSDGTQNDDDNDEIQGQRRLIALLPPRSHGREHSRRHRRAQRLLRNLLVQLSTCSDDDGDGSATDGESNTDSSAGDTHLCADADKDADADANGNATATATADTCTNKDLPHWPCRSCRRTDDRSRGRHSHDIHDAATMATSPPHTHGQHGENIYNDAHDDGHDNVDDDNDDDEKGADLERTCVRMDGLEVYAVVSALTVATSLSLAEAYRYDHEDWSSLVLSATTSASGPTTTSDSILDPHCQHQHDHDDNTQQQVNDLADNDGHTWPLRLVLLCRAVFLLSSASSALLGLHSTLIFSLVTMYGRTAAGMDHMRAFRIFYDGTADQRRRGFRSFLLSIYAFLVQIVLVVTAKCPDHCILYPALGFAFTSLAVRKIYVDTEDIVMKAGIIFATSTTHTSVSNAMTMEREIENIPESNIHETKRKND